MTHRRYVWLGVFAVEWLTDVASLHPGYSIIYGITGGM
jgi:hypothetical protein